MRIIGGESDDISGGDGCKQQTAGLLIRQLDSGISTHQGMRERNDFVMCRTRASPLASLARIVRFFSVRPV